MLHSDRGIGLTYHSGPVRRADYTLDTDVIARALSTLIFWILMCVLIPGAAVVVVFFYLPFVALKAIWLAITGRLSATTGLKPGRTQDDASVQPRARA
ncbi:MAG: hypothetical protein AB7I19_13540 [Planctomycetota bacterium]